jgi:integrase
MRPVPLNDTAIEVLNQLNTEGVYEHLFINKKTKKPYVNIAKIWDKIRIKAGLPHLRIHDLRHQAASNLINSGSSLYIVQQILGHSDPIITQRYAHLSMKSLNDASDSASAIIKGAMDKKSAALVG